MSAGHSGSLSVFASRQAGQLRRAAEAVPGLHRLDRPVVVGEEPTFSLAYVRSRADGTGGAGRLPVLVIPGGPGLASAYPYASLRRKATQRGLDVLMVEHRGVGLSRRSPDGADLPPEAMLLTFVVDDLRAVLDAEGIERAVVVGSSYGTYVAQAFAREHPDRVGSLVLDSPMMGAGNTADTGWATALLYDGARGDRQHRRLAGKVRDLAEEAASGAEGTATGDTAVDSAPAQLGRAVRIVYEFAGPEVLDAYLNQLRVGACGLTSRTISRMGEADTGTPTPYYMEFDLVGEIAFRELDYAGTAHEDAVEKGPRGLFSRTADFAEIARQFSPFAGEPYDLEAALAALEAPVLVVSGDRDLRTPRPQAERVLELARKGTLLTVPEHGHSALDTHHAVFLAALEAAADGTADALGDAAGEEGVRRWNGPRSGGGPSAVLGPVLTALLAVDRLLPRRHGRRLSRGPSA